jgi:hypothetical protein
MILAILNGRVDEYISAYLNSFVIPFVNMSSVLKMPCVPQNGFCSISDTTEVPASESGGRWKPG